MRDAKGGVDCFSVIKIYDMLSAIKTGISRQTLNLTYLQILLVCQFAFKARGSFIPYSLLPDIDICKAQTHKPVSPFPRVTS